MLEYIKENKYSLILIILTFVLGAIAVFTAIRLYQLRTTAPQDTSASGEDVIESCEVLVIPLSTPTPTPTQSPEPTPTPSQTPIASPTPTPTTPTPTSAPLSCDTECSSDADCKSINSDYICYSATLTCRHVNYPQENDCQAPPTSTATESPTPAPTSTSIAQPDPTPSPEVLEDAGVSAPTLIGMGFAALLLVGALLLAM